MREERLTKQQFYGELDNGKRPQHKPKKQFKDCVKNNLKELGINVDDWEKAAKNRAGWRHSVKEGRNTFEKQRLKHAKVKRDARKGIVVNLPDEMKSWKCETCGRPVVKGRIRQSPKYTHTNKHNVNPDTHHFYHHSQKTLFVLSAAKCVRQLPV